LNFKFNLQLIIRTNNQLMLFGQNLVWGGSSFWIKM